MTKFIIRTNLKGNDLRWTLSEVLCYKYWPIKHVRIQYIYINTRRYTHMYSMYLTRASENVN